MLGGINRMKKVFRVLVLGLMATLAFTAVFAQERTREVVYKEYMDNYESTTVEGIQKAINAAKEYIEKFNTPDDEEQVKYFKSAIPSLEEGVVKLKRDVDVKAEQARWNKMLVAFDTAFKAAQKDKNWDNTITAGKEALNFQPQYIDKKGVDNVKFDLTIVLTAVGYDLAEAKNNKYNAETIEWAKKVIQQTEAGQTSERFGNYGTHQFKTPEYPDGKNNTLGWMNYTIGYIMFNGQNDAKGALPYLYKATQTKSATQNFPMIYGSIGGHYYVEVAKIDEERLKIQAANNNQDNEESLAKYALEKGYAERGADAYARAYKLIKDDPKVAKDYKALIYERLQQLYKFRHNDKTDGLDTYVASIMSKPFPNPTSAVEPIKEEADTATTTSTTSATPSTTTTKTANTKAVTATTAKPAASNTAKTPTDKKPR